MPLKHSIVSIAILALAQATVVHAQADAGDFTKSVTIEKDVGIAMTYTAQINLVPFRR